MEIWGDWVMPIHHLTDNEGRGERNMQHAQLTTWQVTKHYHYCAVHNKLQQPAQKCFWWLIAKQVTNKCLSCSWTLHNDHTVHTLSEMPQVVWITLWYNCKSEVLSWGSCLHDHSTLVVVGITLVVCRVPHELQTPHLVVFMLLNFFRRQMSTTQRKHGPAEKKGNA